MNDLNFSPQAMQDLFEIRSYLSVKDKNAANRVAAAVVQDIGILQTFPMSGVSLKSKLQCETDLRMLACRYDYLAIYKVEENAVYISRIISGRLDYMRVLMRD